MLPHIEKRLSVLTPALNGSILDGVTRNTVIALLQAWKIPVEERSVSLEEVIRAHSSGALEEAFGTGTAAVISPIGEMNWQGERMVIANGRTGELAKRLYDTITGIQTGALPDEYGWTMEV